MKLVSDKDNIYVFRSFPMTFHLFSFLLLCIAARLFFLFLNLTKTLICLLLVLFFTYLGTMYCKITFDLNQGLVHCRHFLRFKLKNGDFSINDIEKITAEERIIEHVVNHNIKKTIVTSLSIQTTSADNNVTSFALGTTKEKLRESVELMNSLLEQYRQKQGAGSEIAKSPCSKP